MSQCLPLEGFREMHFSMFQHKLKSAIHSRLVSCCNSGPQPRVQGPLGVRRVILMDLQTAFPRPPLPSLSPQSHKGAEGKVEMF